MKMSRMNITYDVLLIINYIEIFFKLTNVTENLAEIIGDHE